jgi:hypothetical protein
VGRRLLTNGATGLFPGLRFLQHCKSDPEHVNPVFDVPWSTSFAARFIGDSPCSELPASQRRGPPCDCLLTDRMAVIIDAAHWRLRRHLKKRQTGTLTVPEFATSMLHSDYLWRNPSFGFADAHRPIAGQPKPPLGSAGPSGWSIVTLEASR